MNEFSIEGTGDRKFLTFAQKQFITYPYWTSSHFWQPSTSFPGSSSHSRKGCLGMTSHSNFVGWGKQCEQWLPQILQGLFIAEYYLARKQDRYSMIVQIQLYNLSLHISFDCFFFINRVKTFDICNYSNERFKVHGNMHTYYKTPSCLSLQLLFVYLLF